MTRPCRIVGLGLATVELSPAEAARAFTQPATAIATLTHDLTRLWDDYRSSDPNERRVGSLALSSGAYLQWIGFASGLAVEVSSNTYLTGSSQLTGEQEAALVRTGFRPPEADEPNFWLFVEHRDDVPSAAWSMVAAMTAAFAVYVG